jgi:aminoglycoside phosphotransferase (APT) family kinase protein
VLFACQGGSDPVHLSGSGASPHYADDVDSLNAAEHPLTGGNMAGPVVRVGATVRRATTPQTPTVHRLLRHVRAQGVAWVPEVYGTDDQGREVLSFIAGEVVHDLPSWLWNDSVLTAVAGALRQWHDATSSFPHTAQDVWWAPARGNAEVICHTDFAPYNHVFVDGTFVGAIDFDLCHPGPRLWDLAYTAYRYVPLTPLPEDEVPDHDSWGRSPLPREVQQARLAAFLDAYAGRDAGLRYPAADLLETLVERLDQMADWCQEQDSAALQGNGVMYRAHARWVEAGGLAV